MKKKKIVVIGGGTGTFTVLSGLKKVQQKYHLELSAVVSMADDGGSTGVLRDELGVLPPGDIRQCLVALSTSGLLMRELMNYRFPTGTLKGHNFGNLLLSALEKVTGDFGTAVEKASEILRCDGKVIPATLDKVNLEALLTNGEKIKGQKMIHFANMSSLEKIYLFPKGIINPNAAKAIKEADIVIIGPGDFYSSLVPNFLIKGIPEAISKTKAKKLYVCNLMTKKGHTDGFSVTDFVKKIEFYLKSSIDIILYNNKKAPLDLIGRYAREGEHPVSTDIESHEIREKKKFIGGDLFNKKIIAPKKGDMIQRNLIRHDSDKLAKLILKALE